MAAVHLGLALLLRLGWAKAAAPASQPVAGALPPISVLIAARNEASNLDRHLPPILEQAYPQFEVYVLLNQTTDDSLAVLRKWQARYPQLRWWEVDPVPSGWAPKKWALQRGVQTARYAHLALIDADCMPESGWLAGIGRRMGQGAEVVLGLGLYRPQPGRLNAFIRYETVYTALQYIGAAAWGHPYMAVGRNLAYTRDFFLRHGGLTPWRASLSGDDDLLIGAHARFAKTAAMIEPGTRTWSAPAHSWTAWWQQKTRHVSASAHYSLINKALLAIFHLSHLLTYLGIGAGLVGEATAGPTLGLYICYVGLKAWILAKPARVYWVQPLLYQWFGLDLSYFLYNLSVVPLGLIKRPAWKSRIPE